MNIKQAKQQIRNAMTAYFTKDRFGHYVIPPEKQRPVFLMGPPGIGKTAVMEQVAAEMGVGIVSYSMTHHTRQSALGLPFIVQKEYDGKLMDVSEYTMSEIIASVHDCIRDTGKREGILFLDEINCVSETLTPAMLQFLQYKTFGRHRVPQGWIVVTAGNPPEYNNSVKEFDIVTWDRLKRVDIEPDYPVWKEYACEKGIHPAVTTYLDCKKDDFYSVETTVDGKRFVTARGWSDLSDMITLYEQHGIAVDEDLVGQYLHDPEIAKNFAIYYDLYRKYRADYQIPAILEGAETAEIRERAASARFDERISLIGLLLDALVEETGNVVETELLLQKLMDQLRLVRVELLRQGSSARDILADLSARLEQEASAAETLNTIPAEEIYRLRCTAEMLEELRKLPGVPDALSNRSAFAAIKADFDRRTQTARETATAAKLHLEEAFRFCEQVFPEGQELIILVTELTIHPETAKFIARHGCEGYYRYNSRLLFDRENRELLDRIEALELEDIDG